MKILNALRDPGKNRDSRIKQPRDDGLLSGSVWLGRTYRAILRFMQPESDWLAARHLPGLFPHWHLLAGALEETPADLVLRFALPGIGKDDCRITIEGRVLHLIGEQRLERQTRRQTGQVVARFYGAFESFTPLPQSVDTKQAQASWFDGVLVIRLPKSRQGQEAG